MKILIIIPALLLLTACQQTTTSDNVIVSTQDSARPDNELAIEKCIELCYSVKDDIDLSNGPCLSNNIHPDWVCDIAHSPRTEIDNQAENQCSSFRERKTSHFVELTPECEFIKFY